MVETVVAAPYVGAMLSFAAHPNCLPPVSYTHLTFGKTADKKRKLYNGMIKCDLFMYLK